MRDRICDADAVFICMQYGKAGDTVRHGVDDSKDPKPLTMCIDSDSFTSSGFWPSISYKYDNIGSTGTASIDMLDYARVGEGG